MKMSVSLLRFCSVLLLSSATAFLSSCSKENDAAPAASIKATPGQSNLNSGDFYSTSSPEAGLPLEIVWRGGTIGSSGMTPSATKAKLEFRDSNGFPVLIVPEVSIAYMVSPINEYNGIINYNTPVQMLTGVYTVIVTGLDGEVAYTNFGTSATNVRQGEAQIYANSRLVRNRSALSDGGGGTPATGYTTSFPTAWNQSLFFGANALLRVYLSDFTTGTTYDVGVYPGSNIAIDGNGSFSNTGFRMQQIRNVPDGTYQVRIGNIAQTTGVPPLIGSSLPNPTWIGGYIIRISN